MNIKFGDEIIEAPNTTPESLDLIKMMKKTHDLGIQYFVMEVSSHALEMGRVEMLILTRQSLQIFLKTILITTKIWKVIFMLKEKLF